MNLQTRNHSCQASRLCRAVADKSEVSAGWPDVRSSVLAEYHIRSWTQHSRQLQILIFCLMLLTTCRYVQPSSMGALHTVHAPQLNPQLLGSSGLWSPPPSPVWSRGESLKRLSVRQRPATGCRINWLICFLQELSCIYRERGTCWRP